MPELAEVEYFRRQWDGGLGHCITRVSLHGQRRIFRGVDLPLLVKVLTGSKLLRSEARGKQMLFRYSKSAWLGLHLGMTGSLRTEHASFTPGKHDHLVIHQALRTLVFTDPRQFGRVQFHHGKSEPEWWCSLPPALDSADFTITALCAFLLRHRRLSIKAALLLQQGFPGIGNWMADEILWRAKLDPKTPAGELNGQIPALLWRTIRFVSRGAMKHVSPSFSDPPKSWLFNQRWKRDGVCPFHGTPLKREIVGGRTTAWCPRCQVKHGQRSVRARPAKNQPVPIATGKQR